MISKLNYNMARIRQFIEQSSVFILTIKSMLSEQYKHSELKFLFSKKAMKIEENFTDDLKLTT